MTTLYQFKRGLAAHKDIIALSGPVMNIILALKFCHFDILSNIAVATT